MVVASDPFFPFTNRAARLGAGHIVAALLTSEAPTIAAAAAPAPLPPEAEERRTRGPPQRDKGADKTKFNLEASLQEQDQLKVLAMLNANHDRFAFSMEDLEPSKFKGEPMRLDLNSDKPIFRPVVRYSIV